MKKTSRSKPFHKRYDPPLTSYCLCGSGIKFKRCCREKLEDASGRSIDEAYSLIRSGDFEAAFKNIRREITKYSILHKTNTAPYLPSKGVGIAGFLQMDINAMSELVGHLLYCYRELSDYDSLSYDLERLRSNINDTKWQRKITYFQVLAALKDSWDEKIGKREVKRLLPIDDENDPEIIQLYLHFCNEDLTFTKFIVVVDRLVSIVTKPSERLHYKVFKGVKYLTTGEESDAEAI